MRQIIYMAEGKKLLSSRDSLEGSTVVMKEFRLSAAALPDFTVLLRM